MLENYVWSQTHEWGTNKHPPLFAWIVGIWFELFPRNNASYYILSYVNSAVGLLGVYFFTKAVGLQKYAIPAVLMLSMALPYSTLAGKFNANTVLLSIWPWVAWAFVRSIKTHGLTGFISTTLLAILAALSILGKYYSGVFLLGLFIVSLISKEARNGKWYQGYKPYLAFCIFIGLLLPHFMWVYHHDFITLRYINEQGAGHTNWKALFKFLLIPIFYWMIPLILLFQITARDNPSIDNLLRMLKNAWKPDGFDDGLFLIAILPWIITLIFGLLGTVELSTPWAIPIGFAYTLLWLRNLDINHIKQLEIKTTKIFGLSLIASIFFSIIYAAWQSETAQRSYYLPREELVESTLISWDKRYPNSKLEWVGGDRSASASFAFYGNSGIQATSEFPDRYPSLYLPLNKWSQRAGLLICDLSEKDSARTSACVDKYTAWVEEQGKTPSVILIRITRRGWRFKREMYFDYAGVTYIP